jgi:hypothetical protein
MVWYGMVRFHTVKIQYLESSFEIFSSINECTPVEDIDDTEIVVSFPGKLKTT